MDREVAPDSKKSDPFLGLNRNVWLVRCLGAALFMAGWGYFALAHFGSARFFLDTLVFGVFGAFAITTAYGARRHTVELERELRLSLIKRNIELESMSTRDNLTHLFNRGHFFDRFERELETARGFQRPLSVLVIDIRGTRDINDAHGHRVGDRVLAGFGRFLAEQARASDVPGRIGGDEFAVILPDTGEQAARAAASRILQALDKTTILEENELTIKLTASVGAAGYPWGADTVDGIMRLADESVRAQKQEARPTTAAAATSSGQHA